MPQPKTTPKTPPPPRVAGAGAGGASSSGPPRPKPGPAPRTPPKPKVSVNKIRDNIAQQVTMAGMMVGTADPVGGFILLTNADSFAETWAAVAEVNPRVKGILENMFSASVYANAGAASLALLLPLLTHYGVLPRAWFNPAAIAVTGMEEAHANGTTLADMLAAHAAASAAARDFDMSDFASAMNGQGG